MILDELTPNKMSKTIDKYIKVSTFSMVNNHYQCHPYLFIAENYSTRLMIMSFWAPAPKFCAEEKKFFSCSPKIFRYITVCIPVNRDLWPQSDPRETQQKPENLAPGPQWDATKLENYDPSGTLRKAERRDLEP